MNKHTITTTNTLTPIGAVILRDGKPVDLTSLTVKFFGVKDDGTSWITATTTGISKHPTSTFTVDTSLDILKSVAHSVHENDQVVLSTSGTLPTGLSATTYFAKAVTPNAFQVATIPQGTAVDITASGSGTHSFYVVGSVQFAFTSTHVATAGTFWGWFTTTSGSDVQHYPFDGRTLRIEIVDAA